MYFMVSPYTRTRITYEIVLKRLNPKEFAAKEDPRLRGNTFARWILPRTRRVSLGTSCPSPVLCRSGFRPQAPRVRNPSRGHSETGIAP